MLDLITEQQHLNVKIISISNLRNENDANIFLKLFIDMLFSVGVEVKNIS